MPKSPHAKPLDPSPESAAPESDPLYPEGEVFSPAFVKACPNPAVRAYLRSLAWQALDREKAQALAGRTSEEPPPFLSEAEILDVAFRLRLLSVDRFATQVRAGQAPPCRLRRPHGTFAGALSRATE